jgi:hypothetical protein
VGLNVGLDAVQKEKSLLLSGIKQRTKNVGLNEAMDVSRPQHWATTCLTQHITAKNKKIWSSKSFVSMGPE